MKTRIVIATCLLLLAAPALQAADPQLETDEQKLMYVLGQLFAQNVAQFELTQAELDLIQLGLADGAMGRDSRVDLATFDGTKIQSMLQARVQAAATKEKALGNAWVVEQAASESGSVTAENGSVYREVAAGDGASPQLTEQVRVPR